MTAGTRVNDPKIQRLIEEANRGADSAPDAPAVTAPPDTVFQLAAGYMQDNGQWIKEFEVRELTGRDEEALARIPDVGRGLVAMMERATIRLGHDQATPERLDTLVGGDWDTVLLAVRAVSFGPTLDIKRTCVSCETKYTATIDITADLAIRTANPEDMSWTVQGKRSTYEVSIFSGDTQRKIFDLMAENKSTALINTEILHDSINKIDGMPVMGRDQVRDISIADRRVILDTITDHRVGPDLEGVTIKCPTCGHEQTHPLTAAALFQWN